MKFYILNLLKNGEKPHPIKIHQIYFHIFSIGNGVSNIRKI